MIISLGDRVRIVSMNGCMAHIRENIREGQIVSVRQHRPKGALKEYTFATIQLDNGETVEKCAESRLWNLHNGLPEYQE